MNHTRFDFGRLNKATPLATGGARIPAYVTRTGVLNYSLPDGTIRRELRHPAEVFSEDSIDSLRGATVVVGHRGLVGTKEWKSQAVGFVGEQITEDASGSDKLVAANIYVRDEPTLAEVDAGKLVECSAGYNCELLMTPGEYNGEKYDAIQRDIRYDHIALGPRGWGRAGPSVALRLDGLAMGSGDFGESIVDAAKRGMIERNARAWR